MPGRVDHDAAAGQHDQLAMRRRVPPLVVVGTRLLHRHPLAAGEPVHERRLADAARADQDARSRPAPSRARSASSPGRSRALTTCTGTPSATASTSATSAHGSSSRSAFVSTISGHRAALPDRDEVALDPPRLEIRAERRDDERDVDVRGERLRLRRQPRRLPHDRAPARQHRADQPVAEPDPVADRDVDALVHQPSGQAGPDDAVGRLHVVRSAVRGDRRVPARGRAPDCSASSGFHPSAPRSNSDNAGSPSGHGNEDGAAAVSRKELRPSRG